MIYAIFETSTGRIASIVCCQDEVIERHLASGQSYIQCDQSVSSDTHYIDVSSEAMLIVKMPEKPGPYYVFDYSSHEWAIDLQIAAANERAIRDRLLLASDWADTVSAKQRMTESEFEAWAAYRQALRDITNQSGFPLDIQRPAAPQ